MSSRRWQVILLVVLGLALASAVLALFMRDLVREYVVVPVSYVAWLVDLVINSIPQSTYWALLVAIAALVAWRAILLPLRGRGHAEGEPSVARWVERSHLVERQSLLARMDESRFARERIAFELRALVVRQIAFQDHQSVDEVEKRVRAGTLAEALALPDEVMTLLSDWQHWMVDKPTNPWVRRLQAIGRRLTPRREPGSGTSTPTSTPYLRQVAQVTNYLEKQLALSAADRSIGATLSPGGRAEEKNGANIAT
jgi:hypothetical protein